MDPFLHAGASPAVPVLGPVDRVGFLVEQARRRRQGRWLEALCAVAIALTGLPLSLLLTPVAFALAALAARALPPGAGGAGLRAALHRFGDILPRALDLVTQGRPRAMDWLEFAGATAITLLPGLLLALAIWVAVRAAFLRAGAGGMLLALRAREPAAGELTEHRLSNVVEEVAIAAGLPAPRVMVLDADAPNAAVVGSRPGDATLLVTRGLLARESRNEVQAVVAHLVASVGNGDLRLGQTFVSSFVTMGLVGSVFDAVFGFSRSAAADAVRTLRFVLGGSGGAREAAAVQALLERGLDAPRDDGIGALMNDLSRTPPVTRLGKLLKAVPPLQVIVLPFFFLFLPFLLARIPILVTRGLIAGPFIALAWRNRRYLADATAVQLTRDPDGLVAALISLSATPTSVSGGEWADFLFIVTEQGGLRRPRSTERSPGLGTGTGNPHPSVEKRVRRLQAMGARRGPLGRSRGMGPFAVLFLALVFSCIAPLLGVAFALAFLLGGGFPLMLVAAALALLSRLLL